MAETPFKSGHIAIAGRPNVGKSTLFNALVGQRLSIVSPKPQTTRTNLLGISTDARSQMMFLDTPGLLEARYRLHNFMNDQIREALQSADVLLGIVDAAHFEQTFDEGVIAAFQTWSVPRVIALNKIDLVAPEKLEPCLARLRGKLAAQAIIPVSATRGTHVPELRAALQTALPPGPQFYPEDMLAENPERFFVAEFIREAVFERLRQELPYAIAVVVETFREDRPKVYIQANIVVERHSQKGIVIGNGGRTLKNIGQTARRNIETFLGREVFLELHVKVLENWRKKDSALRRLGYGM